MANFKQVSAGKELVFALDDKGKVFYTNWLNGKWRDWMPLPAHPDAGDDDGED